jgi:hypothetical protein
MAHHQNPEQNHALKITNKFSQNNNKAQAFQTIKYQQNIIYEIKARLH